MGFSHSAARCNNLISRTLFFSLALFLLSFLLRVPVPSSAHPSAATTAATAAAAAATSFFILTSRALPPRPLELPPTLTALPQPVYAETRRSQSDVRRFVRPARTIASRFFYLMQSLVGFRRQALPSPCPPPLHPFPSSVIPSLRRSPRRTPTDPLPYFAILFFLLSLLYFFFFSICLGAIVSAY